ncbi:hypothetical protein BAVI_07651 [Neobacillus vireti LMG 21834]|uniref:Group-specific protein n=1 Tax=Neobacillus vireti LMG 21834 TaxID=1131730 RepID=A0AB94IQS5_9BACI|nr:hypothetical protein BAVI_07651 [Neobacillus vireti LMG 21834]KLT18905.1 hypothetical protein AA980_06115 [Neobacillus vireti]
MPNYLNHNIFAIHFLPENEHFKAPKPETQKAHKSINTNTSMIFNDFFTFEKILSLFVKEVYENNIEVFDSKQLIECNRKNVLTNPPMCCHIHSAHVESADDKKLLCNNKLVTKLICSFITIISNLENVNNPLFNKLDRMLTLINKKFAAQYRSTT